MENKYQDFIIKMFSKMFREEWMDDNDWTLWIKESKKSIDYQKLEKELKIGEQNGYTLEQQEEALKTYNQSLLK